jgi:hypothetical protein
MLLRKRLLEITVMLTAVTSGEPANAQTAAAGAFGDTLPLQHPPTGNRLHLLFGSLAAAHVSPPFSYIGGSRFILAGTADAEQHLFVVADSTKTVRRMYWIQVEHRLPSRPGQYDYAADSLVMLSGIPFFVNVRTYTTPPEPSSDRGRAFALLNSKGYRVPEGATRLRLVYLPEQQARRELMIIYLEWSPRAEPLARDSLLARAGRGIQLDRNQ